MFADLMNETSKVGFNHQDAQTIYSKESTYSKVRVNTASPTETVQLRQVVGGSPRSLQECTRLNCSVRPSESGEGHCPFGVVGLSYRTASLELRGRASFASDGGRQLL